MNLFENSPDTCINTGLFPGCISGNFVFGNDLKVDVRTGKAISDGLFGNDQQPMVAYAEVKGVYTDRDGVLRNSVDDSIYEGDPDNALVDGSDKYDKINEEMGNTLIYGSEKYKQVMDELGYSEDDFVIEEFGHITTIKEKDSSGMYQQTRIYNNETLDEVHETLFDSSGENIMRNDVYNRTYGEGGEPGGFELQYSDRWFVDSEGNTYTDHKQPNSWGCVLTTYANMTGKTPGYVDNWLSNNNGYNKDSEGNYTLMNMEKYANTIDMTVTEATTDSSIRNNLDMNVENQIVTEARFNGHSVMISGARYDANGEITDYLINDPGRRANNPINRDTLFNEDWRKVHKIRWMKPLD